MDVMVKSVHVDVMREDARFAVSRYPQPCRACEIGRRVTKCGEEDGVRVAVVASQPTGDAVLVRYSRAELRSVAIGMVLQCAATNAGYSVSAAS